MSPTWRSGNAAANQQYISFLPRLFRLLPHQSGISPTAREDMDNLFILLLPYFFDRFIAGDLRGISGKSLIFK